MEIPASAEKVGTCTNPNLATTKKKSLSSCFGDYGWMGLLVIHERIRSRAYKLTSLYTSLSRKNTNKIHLFIICPCVSESSPKVFFLKERHCMRMHVFHPAKMKCSTWSLCFFREFMVTMFRI